MKSRAKPRFGAAEFHDCAKRSLDAILAVLDEVQDTTTAREVVSGQPCRALIDSVAMLVDVARTLEALAFGEDSQTDRSGRSREFLEKLGFDPNHPQNWRLHDRLCLAAATLSHYKEKP